MKTIDTKSLIIGIFATLLAVVLISGKSENENNLEFVSHPEGVAVFNKQSKMIYTYRIYGLKILPGPFDKYKVSDDGASIIEIK